MIICPDLYIDKYELSWQLYRPHFILLQQQQDLAGDQKSDGVKNNQLYWDIF